MHIRVVPEQPILPPSPSMDKREGKGEGERESEREGEGSIRLATETS
jgi:hypothetical protein